MKLINELINKLLAIRWTCRKRTTEMCVDSCSENMPGEGCACSSAAVQQGYTAGFACA